MIPEPFNRFINYSEIKFRYFSYLIEGHFYNIGYEKDHIYIANPLKVLRNFGQFIKNLGINCICLDEKRCTEIENYLAEYCSDSLKNLSVICNTSKTLFENLPKPLKNVDVFKIKIMHPQNVNHIPFINENTLPNVNNITIYRKSEACFVKEPKNIHLKNIEYFTFSSLYCISEYPFSFGNLKHLTFKGQCIVNDALCELIASVKDLKTLNILNVDERLLNRESFVKLLNLSNILSTVEEMRIQYAECMFTNDFLHLFEQNRNIRKLTFDLGYSFINKSRYEDFLETISSSSTSDWSFRVEKIHQYMNIFHTLYVFERRIDG